MGPLEGIRMIELGGIGPSTWAAMMLSDLGAEVLRIDRVSSAADPDEHRPDWVVRRGRRSLALDLKSAGGVAVLLRLVERADAIIDPFRPRVAERLGFGPDVCLDRNPRLVYVRATGWGQSGPYSQAPGHDINYISTTGALASIGRQADRPAPPLNLLGDYGGGGMLVVVGMLAALLERARSGRGQVVDAAMVDGVALLTTLIHGLRAEGLWNDQRENNLVDGFQPFYDVYATADGRYVSVGAGEPQFFRALLELLGLEGEFSSADQVDRHRFPEMRRRFAEVFATKTRGEWAQIGVEGPYCLTPVLTWGEAPDDPHNRARGVYVEVDGVVQPAPAPRFSRTPARIQSPPSIPGAHSAGALLDWGFRKADIERLEKEGVIRDARSPDSG